MINGIQSSGSERFSAALFDASLLTPEPPPGGSFFAISHMQRVWVRRKVPNRIARLGKGWHGLCVAGHRFPERRHVVRYGSAAAFMSRTAEWG